MADQWQVEPSGPGVLGRLLVPQSSTKPAVTAFLVGLAGAGAFVASLVLDWQKITIPQDSPSSSSSSSRSSAPDELVLTAGLGSIDVLGLVYLLGGLGLITILGSVLVRPESALRLRMGAAGLGAGIVGVLVAIALRLKETILNIQGMFGGISSQNQQEVMDGSTVAYEPGLFAGFAAVVMLSAAVWLAGAPAARAAARWADFVANYPAYAAYHSAQFHGGPMYPPTAAPNGSVAPTQTSHGAIPTGQPVAVPAASVPLPTPAYPPPAMPYAPAPPTPPYPSPPASAYAPAPAAPYGPPPGPQYAPQPGPQYAPPAAPAHTPPPSSTWSRPGHVDELTVMPSEPLDPGTNPDVWRA